MKMKYFKSGNPLTKTIDYTKFDDYDFINKIKYDTNKVIEVQKNTYIEHRKPGVSINRQRAEDISDSFAYSVTSHTIRDFNFKIVITKIDDGFKYEVYPIELVSRYLCKDSKYCNYYDYAIFKGCFKHYDRTTDEGRELEIIYLEDLMKRINKASVKRNYVTDKVTIKFGSKKLIMSNDDYCNHKTINRFDERLREYGLV